MGSNVIVSDKKGNLKFITSGSLLMKSLDFESKSGNIILKLLEQASARTYSVSGDGSTTTILIACQLLKSSLRFLVNGYNPIYWLKKYIFDGEMNFYPPNYTSCDKYSGCIYEEVCRNTGEARAYKLTQLFIERPKWDVGA